MMRDDDAVRCVACMCCPTVCPADCITIIPAESDDHGIEKKPAIFEIEEALGAEHSDKERERQIRREARAELERMKLEQQRREHTLRKELEACQTEIGRLLGLLRRHGIDPHPGN